LITKIKSSLTLKIFLGTFLILLFACCVTYGFVAYVIPHSYSTDMYQELTVKLENLAADFGHMTYEDSEKLLMEFAKDNNVIITIYDETGEMKNELNGMGSVESEATFDSTSEASCYTIEFSDSAEPYQIVIQGDSKPVRRIIAILSKIWYKVLACVFAISLLTAFVYARFITKPIVKASRISEKIADMDFGWRYEEKRTDEIGVLEHNINVLSDRLEFALSDLQRANEALQKDIESEKEKERQMRQFFSAVSHELKTPITIIKGQLCGMLDNVGSYADRDKYLARSLVVANRMEKMVQELLTVARLEQNDTSYNPVKVCLSELAKECVEEYEDLFEQKEQKVHMEIVPDLWILGDENLLRKTISNVLSNAAFYSPEKEEITVALKEDNDHVCFQVENRGVWIEQEHIPRLFDAFYRVDASRNRETGGTGLGLYLVKKIMEKHNGECQIFNTEHGVQTDLIFTPY